MTCGDTQELSAPLQLEASEPIDRDYFSLTPLSSRDGKSGGMRRYPRVIRPFVNKRQVSLLTENILVSHLCHLEMASPMTCRDTQGISACRTLISSGDYYLMTCNLWLAALRYFASFVHNKWSPETSQKSKGNRLMRSVKFRTVAEVEKRCFCAIRKFP